MGTRETVTIKLNDITVSYTECTMDDASIMSDEEIQSLLSRFPKLRIKMYLILFVGQAILFPMYIMCTFQMNGVNYYEIF